MNVEHTLETVFDLAISREIAANTLYADLAGRVKSPAVKATFKELAREETRHRVLLESLKTEPLLQTRFKVAPDYHITETEQLPEFTPDMPMRDALVLAMKNEQRAAALYRGMAEMTSDARVRALFEELTTMEMGHKSTLETLFVDVGYPEVF